VYCVPSHTCNCSFWVSTVFCYLRVWLSANIYVSRFHIFVFNSCSHAIPLSLFLILMLLFGMCDSWRIYVQTCKEVRLLLAYWPHAVLVLDQKTCYCGTQTIEVNEERKAGSRTSEVTLMVGPLHYRPASPFIRWVMLSCLHTLCFWICAYVRAWDDEEVSGYLNMFTKGAETEGDGVWRRAEWCLCAYMWQVNEWGRMLTCTMLDLFKHSKHSKHAHICER